ncbi:hypothetical protein DYU11_27085 [Fibrisoma montanum]|uniref:Uncharacterized protein n=1 Tax=Fibrisoma montanum TaxID=2305895 RepID=A0A418LZN8_9BACT|nr:hypothetical protein DYU11_27085 [Fibrisoma montanum]
MLSACNPNKTVFISNKTGSTITLRIDEDYKGSEVAFTDSLNGLVVKDKKVFDFGKGRWTKDDKAHLEELLRHTKIVREGNAAKAEVSKSINVSLIRFDVEELWVRIN